MAVSRVPWAVATPLFIMAIELTETIPKIATAKRTSTSVSPRRDFGIRELGSFIVVYYNISGMS